MHLGYTILQQRQVPVVVEQPGLDAGNVRGQPFAVAERHEHVLPAVQQQDRDRDVGQVESPRPDRAVVVPPSLAAGRQTVLRGGGQVFGQLAAQDCRICRREKRFNSPRRILWRRGQDFLPVLVRFCPGRSLVCEERRKSSTFSWPMPAK
jgi:hypothetical protein